MHARRNFIASTKTGRHLQQINIHFGTVNLHFIASTKTGRHLQQINIHFGTVK